MRDRIIERAHADNLKLRAKQSKLKEKLNELQEAREDLSNESGMRYGRGCTFVFLTA